MGAAARAAAQRTSYAREQRRPNPLPAFRSRLLRDPGALYAALEEVRHQPAYWQLTTLQRFALERIVDVLARRGRGRVAITHAQLALQIGCKRPAACSASLALRAAGFVRSRNLPNKFGGTGSTCYQAGQLLLDAVDELAAAAIENMTPAQQERAIAGAPNSSSILKMPPSPRCNYNGNIEVDQFGNARADAAADRAGERSGSTDPPAHGDPTPADPAAALLRDFKRLAIQDGRDPSGDMASFILIAHWVKPEYWPLARCALRWALQHQISNVGAYVLQQTVDELVNEKEHVPDRLRYRMRSERERERRRCPAFPPPGGGICDEQIDWSASERAGRADARGIREPRRDDAESRRPGAARSKESQRPRRQTQLTKISAGPDPELRAESDGGDRGPDPAAAHSSAAASGETQRGVTDATIPRVDRLDRIDRALLRPGGDRCVRGHEAVGAAAPSEIGAPIGSTAAPAATWLAQLAEFKRTGVMP